MDDRELASRLDKIEEGINYLVALEIEAQKEEMEDEEENEEEQNGRTTKPKIKEE